MFCITSSTVCHSDEHQERKQLRVFVSEQTTKVTETTLQKSSMWCRCCVKIRTCELPTWWNNNVEYWTILTQTRQWLTTEACAAALMFRFLVALRCDSWNRKAVHLGYKIILLCLWQLWWPSLICSKIDRVCFTSIRGHRMKTRRRNN